MEQFYNLTINLHVGMVYLTLLMASVMFFVLTKDNPKKSYLGFLPLYYGALTALAFTGAVMINFFHGLTPIVMSIAWIYMLISTIKTYKITKKELILTGDSLKKIKLKYIIDIAILVCFIIYRFV